MHRWFIGYLFANPLQGWQRSKLRLRIWMHTFWKMIFQTQLKLYLKLHLKPGALTRIGRLKPDRWVLNWSNRLYRLRTAEETVQNLFVNHLLSPFISSIYKTSSELNNPRIYIPSCETSSSINSDRSRCNTRNFKNWNLNVSQLLRKIIVSDWSALTSLQKMGVS